MTGRRRDGSLIGTVERGDGVRMQGSAWLSRWSVVLDVSGPTPVPPDVLRGLMWRWFGHHNDQVKPYSCGPLAAYGDGIFELTVAILDDRLQTKLGTLRRRADIGDLSIRVVDRPVALERIRWSDLVGVGSEPVIRLELLTPTGFKSGTAFNVLPTPERVFGHYRRRWRVFGPVEPHIDLASQQIVVRAADIATYSTLVNGFRFDGVTGIVELDVSRCDSLDQQVLRALAATAPFCGTGAATGAGMGVTRVAGVGRGPDPGAESQVRAGGARGAGTATPRSG